MDKIVLDVCYDKCYSDLSKAFDLNEYDLVIAIGPLMMMKFVCKLTKELENHPDRITPNAAAIVSISDSETPNVTEAKKKNNDMDIMADDMGSMLS